MLLITFLFSLITAHGQSLNTDHPSWQPVKDDARREVQEFLRDWTPPAEESELSRTIGVNYSQWMGNGDRPKDSLIGFLWYAHQGRQGLASIIIGSEIRDLSRVASEADQLKLVRISRYLDLAIGMKTPKWEGKEILQELLESTYSEVRLQAARALVSENYTLKLALHNQIERRFFLERYRLEFDPRVRATLEPLIRKIDPLVFSYGEPGLGRSTRVLCDTLLGRRRDK